MLYSIFFFQVETSIRIRKRQVTVTPMSLSKYTVYKAGTEDSPSFGVSRHEKDERDLRTGKKCDEIVNL